MPNQTLPVQKLPAMGEVSEAIITVRGQKVIIDRDLAQIYEIPTKRLNEQVKRNPEKFPPELCFRLTKLELNELVANCDRFRNLKHSTSLPYAFTEHGSLMAATVLNSPRAVQMSLFIIRTFTKMRELLISQDDLREKLYAIEQKLLGHDLALKALFNEIRTLLAPAVTSKRSIGFHTLNKSKKLSKSK